MGRYLQLFWYSTTFTHTNVHCTVIWLVPAYILWYYTYKAPSSHRFKFRLSQCVTLCKMCSLWSCCTVVLLLKSVYKSRVAGIVTFKWWGSLAFFLWPSRPLSLSHSRSFPWVEINIAFLWLLYSCCNIYWIKPKRIWVQKTFVSYTRVSHGSSLRFCSGSVFAWLFLEGHGLTWAWFFKAFARLGSRFGGSTHL